MKNNIGIFIVIVVLVGAGAFYGGMTYGKTQLPGNLTAQQRQEMFARNGAPGRMGQPGQAGQAGGGFTSGQILSKDDKSITLKMRDGGSKIIFFSDKTKISKSTDGSLADLENGKDVMVNGTANSDGSINATTINLAAIPAPQPQK